MSTNHLEKEMTQIPRISTNKKDRSLGARALGLVAAVTLACVLPAAASADTTQTLDFDSFASGTQVDTEYSGQGITFTAAVPASGLPIVTDVGTAANSGSKVAWSSCYGCEFVPHNMKATFSTLATAVSARVGIDPDTCTWGVPLILEARNPGGTIVASQTVTAASTGYNMLISANSGTADIASFTIRTSSGGDAGCRFGVDDVSYTTPDGLPSPDFSLDTTTGVAELRQGATTTIPFTINRFNGSNGNISLSTLALPAGVSAWFTPNPVSGMGAASTLTLSASGTAPTFLTPTTVTVSGAPVAGAGSASRTRTISLRVVPNWGLSAAPNPLLVPSCGSATGTVYVSRAAGFPGTVSLTNTALTGGMSATLTPATSTPPSGGAMATHHELRVTKTGTGSMGDRTLTVSSTSAGLPGLSSNVTIRRIAGAVTSFTPTTANAPRNMGEGTAVTIRGTGLCPGSHIRFGNMLADVAPGPMAFAADGTSVTVKVPRLATSGPITVVSPDGTMSSPGSLTVRTARNTEGFAFENYDHPGTSFSDLEATFGAEDTNISVDVCWPFGCDVVTPIPNPLTYLFIAIADGALAGNGSCWGIAVTSQQLTSGRIPYSRFTPAGATNAFQLAAAGGPETALRRHVRRWHVVQLSSEFIQTYVNKAAGNPLIGVSGVRSQIRTELLAGRHPILALRNGGGGHVVVIEDMRDVAGGGFELDVYDSNVPFTSGETAADGGTHFDRMQRSIVTMSAGGTWRHQGAYSGGTWTGGLSSFIQVPFRDIPTDPTLPTSLSGLLSLIVPFANSDVQQVTDAAGRTLLTAAGTANTNPSTMIPGSTVVNSLSGDDANPVYSVPATTKVVEQVRGAWGISYSHGLVGPGFGAKIDGLVGSGLNDELSLDAKNGVVTIDSAVAGGSMAVKIARSEADGDQRGAILHVSGGASGKQTLSLGKTMGSGLNYTSGGNVDVQATITWGGKDGLPGSVALPSMHLNNGEKLVIVPAKWSGLGKSSVKLVVKSATGSVLRTRTVHAQQGAKWVRSTRVVAKTLSANKRRIIVKSKFANVPRNAVVLQVVEVRRKGRVVRRIVRKITPAQAAHNPAWNVKLKLKNGRYTISAGATVLLQAQSMKSSSKAAKVVFVAR